MIQELSSFARTFPRHGWLGIALVLLFWGLNWSLDGMRTHWGFFPLWLGYCLTVDALVLVRTGSSMATRDVRAFAALFLFSAPAWWLFELLNMHTANWHYDGREFFTDTEYAVLATLSFSTVMPAVFETAELAATFRPLREMKSGRPTEPARGTLAGLMAAGWLMLALLLLAPRYFFPFVWGAVYCILDPLNRLLGFRSLLDDTSAGNWRPAAALALGALICGFFWEMWNYYSYPKWIYTVPYVDALGVFEMPLAGYLGYPVFALELFALYHFLVGLFKREEWRTFIRL